MAKTFSDVTYAISDPVCWRETADRSQVPCAATITGVGQGGMVDLIVFPPQSHNGMVKSGVRHIDDPDKKAIMLAGEGTWDHQKVRIKACGDKQPELGSSVSANLRGVE